MLVMQKGGSHPLPPFGHFLSPSFRRGGRWGKRELINALADPTNI